MAFGTSTCLVQPAESGGLPIASKGHAIPCLKSPYDVLIRVSAVALNPCDHKFPALMPTPGAVIGCDFSGIAVEVGSEVGEEIVAGTRLCGFVHGSNPVDATSGAFSEYVVADSRLLLRVPDTWSDLEAAALGGTGWTTVALVMGQILQLDGRPSRPAPARGDGTRCPVLVYGAGTATGAMACQILARSGYDAIVTVSPSTAPLALKYGAVHTVDYAAPDCADQIKKKAKGPLRHVIDCISSPESISCCSAVLGRAGGRFATLEHVPDEWKSRKALKIGMPIAFSAFGRELQLTGAYRRDADPAAFDLAVSWSQEMQTLLDGNSLRCHPVHQLDGRWEGIIEGLRMLQSGEVRGEKLVVSILE